MSLKEIIFFRLPQQFQFLIKGKIQQNNQVDYSNLRLNQNFVLPKYCSQVLKDVILEDSDLRTFSFYNAKIDLDNTLDWRKDHKHDKSSLNKYYTKYKRQNFNEVGDIKYVFEPSRFYFLPFLALYYSAYKKEKSITIIEKVLKEWSDQNPFLESIHWTSGIEVGIRSINLIYTHIVLRSTGALTETIDKTIRELILYNYKFLKSHLSFYSSANNHLVAELSGLTVISSYFTSKEIDKNRKKWKHLLYSEILNQVHDDGVNMELSTHYHAEVTDHFFNALKFVEATTDYIPENVNTRIKKMFNFLNHVDYHGNKTIFGDNDNGYLLFPYFSNKFSIYQSLLQTSDLNYKTKFSTKAIDLRNVLIFGTNAVVSTSIEERKEQNDTIFKTSGYMFFYDTKNKVKLAMDFGDIGDKISAAHGHSDVLHLIFEAFGVPILVDSGTFQYHSRFAKERAYFRGVKAHNTISINNENQALGLTRMSWINTPKVELVEYNIGESSSSITAKHNAYQKFGITHQRHILFNKKEQQVLIEDKMFQTKNARNDNTLQFYLNFNPKLNITHHLDTLTISVKGKEIKIINKEFIEGKFFSGDENEMLGWYSNNYDTIEKGKVFVMSKIFYNSLTLTTKIVYE